MPARFLAPLAVALLSSAQAAPPLVVTAVRFWPVHGATRIAVETNGDFKFRSERLTTPDRVFFDVLGARPRLDRKSAAVLTVSHRFVQRIRIAETQPGVTRIVIDLAQGAEVSASKLSNPDRLMIEVRAPGDTPASTLADAREPYGGSRVEPSPLVTRAPARRFVPPPVEPPAPMAPLPFGPVLRAERSPAVLPVALFSALRNVPGPPVTIKPASPAAAAPAQPPVRQASRPAVPGAETAVPAKPPTTGEGASSLIRALGLKLNRVVLDPGHGGKDQGTASPNGLLEKDLVLDVAKRLGALIEKRLGAEVVYTREDDRFVPLETRTTLANERQADLFLSLHANSSSYRNVAGIETYYLNFTDSSDALEVAARENASSDKSIHELRDVIQKITLHDKAEESREFANRIQASLYTFASRTNPAVRDRGVRKAPFVVLIGAIMPSVLVEIGFISNAREESLLKRPEHRQKLAEALCQGLERYAEGLSHFRVAKGAAESAQSGSKHTNE